MSKPTGKPRSSSAGKTASSKSDSSAKKSAKSKPKKRKPAKSKPSLLRRLLGFTLKLSIVCAIVLGLWTIHLDATVRAKFEGKRWQLPAQVYARTLEMFPEARLSRTDLIAELRQLGYRKVSSRPVKAATYQESSNWVAIHSKAFRFADGLQQGQMFRIEFAADRITRIIDAAGGELSWVRMEPLRIGGIYPAIKEDRILVNLQQVPATLIEALIAIEDKDFYSHFGISLKAIARAFVVNMKAGRVVQGGSTLTQQLVKNFYLDQRQTLWRKANEAIMAMLLEWHYSKEEVLETYLNEIFLGQAGERAIHGIGMASQFYFGKDVESLEAEESALLVALVKGASYYNPRRHPARAKQRRDLVISELAKSNIISPAEADRVQSRALGLIPKPTFSDSRYPAFLDLVKRQLAQDYRQADLQTEGLRIFTTLDPGIQNAAEAALLSTINDRTQSKANKGLQGALISTSVDSGEVLAVVGGNDPRYAGFNRALEADRQIGSLIKPFVYLTALNDPKKYTLATSLQDEPFRLQFENGDHWEPQNYSGETVGEVILQRALSDSLNLATARLGLELEVANVFKTLRRFGATVDVPPYPSVLLGAISYTPLEVTALYQNLISGGFQVPVRAIRAVTRSDGELLTRYGFETAQVMSQEVAFISQYALYDVMRNGTGKRFYQRFSEDYFVGGKTGTTDNYRDSWFVGFNGDILTTVWMGKDDNQPTNLTGASGALEAWIRLYRHLPKVAYTPVTPEAVEWAWVDGKTGELSAENCEGAIALPFVDGSVPTSRSACVDRGNYLQRWLRRWWSS